MINEHTKAVPEAVAELKDEFKDFVGTRVAMLHSEMTAKLRAFRLSAPTLMIGLLLLLTGWFVFTGFLAFAPRPWAYALSFVLVALLYMLVGGATAYTGWRGLRATSLKPERTLRVLKQDRIWLQTEAKTHET